MLVETVLAVFASQDPAVSREDDAAGSDLERLEWACAWARRALAHLQPGAAAGEPATDDKGKRSVTPRRRPSASSSPAASAESTARSPPQSSDHEPSLPPRPDEAGARPAPRRGWILGGFVDIAYAFNHNVPNNHVNRGNFTAPRTNEFTLALAVAYARHDFTKQRPLSVEVALQFGPAAHALLVAEPTPGAEDSKFAGAEVWKHLYSGALDLGLRAFEALLIRLEYRYDRSSADMGYFYRYEATNDDALGLGRDQHTVFFALTGMFEYAL